MLSAEYFIEKLDMKPHQEGGYYKECFSSSTPHDDKHCLWTSIYFLLRNGEVSNLHRLKSDELWYYHSGSPLTIHMISPSGNLITEQLGLNIDNGEKPQVLVPKDYIFGSEMNNAGYALVGCMVSPGFTFEDFELFERDNLLKMYPQHSDVIIGLTR